MGSLIPIYLACIKFCQFSNSQCLTLIIAKSRRIKNKIKIKETSLLRLGVWSRPCMVYGGVPIAKLLHL